MPVIAPLSRALRMAEWEIGQVTRVAALTMVAAGRLRGRRSRLWGRKAVPVPALLLGCLAMAASAAVSQAGMAPALDGGLLSVLFVATVFGAAVAAPAATAQAYVADVTTGERAHRGPRPRPGARAPAHGRAGRPVKEAEQWRA
ncbi:hypothetical protein [Allonocardiopsis opalescens]|nr:hypothetical protein [Allonocardiopsis opalescens]